MPDALQEWQQIPIGGIIPSDGSARKYRTGSWRVKRPVWDGKACTSCMICWIFCPDMAIRVKGREVVGIDTEHCKGCGICVNECPVKGALRMEPGGDYEGGEGHESHKAD